MFESALPTADSDAGECLIVSLGRCVLMLTISQPSTRLQFVEDRPCGSAMEEQRFQVSTTERLWEIWFQDCLFLTDYIPSGTSLILFVADQLEGLSSVIRNKSFASVLAQNVALLAIACVLLN